MKHPKYALLVLLRLFHLKVLGRDAGQLWGSILGLLVIELMLGWEIGISIHGPISPVLCFMLSLDSYPRFCMRYEVY